MTKLYPSLVYIMILVGLGCGKHHAPLSDQMSGQVSPVNTVKNQFDTPDMHQIFGTNHDLAFACEGFENVTVRSAVEVVVPAVDVTRRTITLASAVKYGAGRAEYNFSSNCFSRQGNGCPARDQLVFHHAGLPKNLSVYGTFTVLDPASAKKFDQINLNNFDLLKLTTDQIAVTKDSVFGNPSPARALTLGEPNLSDYEPGTVALVLIDDNRDGLIYQLYKIRVEALNPGQDVQLTYERLAEAPPEAYKNFFCSRRARILERATESEGEATIFARWYSGFAASTFAFDYGVNGFDGRYSDSRRVMSFGDPGECPNVAGKFCVTPGVGHVTGYWGSVVDLGQFPLAQVNRSTWPPLQTLDPASAGKSLEENKTYLITQLNDQDFTFGAIRINEIDPRGRWVKLHWKRVGITAPERFLSYSPTAIDPADAQGSMIMDSRAQSRLSLTARSAHAPPLIFSPAANELQIDNRYYTKVSGILDVSDRFRQLEDLPADAGATNLVETFSGQFRSHFPVRAGAVYLVAAEGLTSRTVLALRVIANVPGESAEVRFRRLYTGLARP